MIVQRLANPSRPAHDAGHVRLSSLARVCGVALALGLLAACSTGRDVETIKPRADKPRTTPPPRTDAKRETGQLCSAKQRGNMLTFNRSVQPDRLITLAAVGDVLLHDSVQKHAAARGGFYGLWAPVADLIQSADLALANLEGPAADGVTKSGRKTRTPPRLYDGRVYSGYPMFNYHSSVVRDLGRAGFDVIQTSNNHSLDRHALGADLTVEAVAAAGLVSTGSKSRKNMSRPWYTITPVSKGGKTYNVAWLACTYGTNGIPDRFNQVLNCYDNRATVMATIRSLKARSDVHAVIVAPHMGGEYYHSPKPKERALVRDMAEAGATAIVGTQPHVIQPIEKITTADGREVAVAYSLGNFVSNQIGLPRRSSIILLLGLDEETQGVNKGKLVVATVGFIPIWMRKGGGVMQAEAIDRVAGGKANRAHLLRHLPAGNLHKPSAPFFKDFACRKGQTG
jgi:hypothetical protein